MSVAEKTEGSRGMDWEFGIGIGTLWYIKQLAIGDLLYSTENSVQYSAIIPTWKKHQKENGYHRTESPYCIAEIITTL